MREERQRNMPHILQTDKPQYAELLQALSAQLKGKPKGHLTYVLYVLAKRYVSERCLMRARVSGTLTTSSIG
jgi:hypothetical protein